MVFIHGCFWHRHDCENGRVMPVARRDFWKAKLTGNAERDKATKAKLEALGWRVLVVWECEIKSERLTSLIEEIRGMQKRRPELL